MYAIISKVARASSALNHLPKLLPTRSSLPIKNFVGSSGGSNRSLTSSVTTRIAASLPIQSANQNKSECNCCEGDEFWLNPCGVDGDILRKILSADGFFGLMFGDARRVLIEVEGFKEKFTDTTFHKPFDAQYIIDINEHYLWLLDPPLLPKHTGAELPNDFYGDVKLDEFVVNCYHILQRFGVAFEQVLCDNGPFQNEFEIRKNELRQVLCAIFCYADARKLTLKEGPPRSVMPDELRNIDDHNGRDLRDFRILKLYVNILEYFYDGIKFMAPRL